ncbi:hypothetical protein ONZ45_g6689 [Pleurotus djamor]|nr:hypothetical protein ONZ45_g6689 [Pleurotus djamor]
MPSSQAPLAFQDPQCFQPPAANGYARAQHLDIAKGLPGVLINAGAGAVDDEEEFNREFHNPFFQSPSSDDIFPPGPFPQTAKLSSSKRPAEDQYRNEPPKRLRSMPSLQLPLIPGTYPNFPSSSVLRIAPSTTSTTLQSNANTSAAVIVVNNGGVAASTPDFDAVTPTAAPTASSEPEPEFELEYYDPPTDIIQKPAPPVLASTTLNSNKPTKRLAQDQSTPANSTREICRHERISTNPRGTDAKFDTFNTALSIDERNPLELQEKDPGLRENLKGNARQTPEEAQGTLTSPTQISEFAWHIPQFTAYSAIHSPITDINLNQNSTNSYHTTIRVLSSAVSRLVEMRKDLERAKRKLEEKEALRKHQTEVLVNDSILRNEILHDVLSCPMTKHQQDDATLLCGKPVLNSQPAPRIAPAAVVSMLANDVRGFSDQYARGRLVSVLEGGYSHRALISGTLAHLCGLVGDTVKVDERWWSPENLDEVPSLLRNHSSVTDMHQR